MIPPPNTTLHDTPLLTCWFGDDGILYSVSKPAERTKENYDALFEVYKKLSQDGTKKLCTLGDVTKTRPSAKSVRDYIGAELPKYIKAMALVSGSPMGREIGYIFKLLQEDPYPIGVFDTAEEAKAWLTDYVKGSGDSKLEKA